MTYESEWLIGDWVRIDGGDIIGRVTGLMWRQDDDHSCEVAWIHNGVSQMAWIAHWRLQHVEK